MKTTITVMAGALLCGSLAAGAQQPASTPAAQEDAAQAATAAPPPEAAAPAMTQKQINDAEVEQAKQEFEAAQQRAASGDGSVDYQPWTAPAQAPAAKKSTAHGSQYHPVSVTGSASQAYASQWGIDTLRVAYTSSGNLVRFSYRVVDPKLAAPLADKKFTPTLYCPKHHAVLSIPVMEKIGPLRQAMGQESGKEYWMAFSNQGQVVKPGDRVNVTIGSFHADGLLVE